MEEKRTSISSSSAANARDSRVASGSTIPLAIAALLQECEQRTPSFGFLPLVGYVNGTEIIH